MEIKQPNPLEVLNKVVRSMDVIDVFLSKSSFDIKVHPKNITPDKARITIEVLPEINIPEGRNVFISTINRTLSCYPNEVTENTESHLLFKITVSFTVVYSMKEQVEAPLSDAALLMFAETNGEYNTHTYFREYIHSTCTRAGIAPIVMPFYRPISPLEINKKYAGIS